MNPDNVLSINYSSVGGKRVLLRADLNVPIQNGKVKDPTRLKRLLPCLKALSAGGAKVVILSHFGRPGGQYDPKMSLKSVADELTHLAEQPVEFISDCTGPAAEQAVKNLEKGSLLLLENLRFNPGEENNDPDFVESLAQLGDIYVNNAFSASHRAHASTEGLAHKLPKYAGPLMMEEINALRTALDSPERPTVALVGGAKVSSKFPLLLNIINKVDNLIVGGGMANTFLAAQGLNVGASLAELSLKDTVLKILTKAESVGCKIILPRDVIVAERFEAGATYREIPVDRVNNKEIILDVGPRSIEYMRDLLKNCRTLLWNGPLGAFEMDPFGKGTFALAKTAAELTKAGHLSTTAGGGDTVAALNVAGVIDDFTYVSSAGGAFLEWLEGRELPGITALL
ncbi:MAG TPA: Phosphoglycerate kinase [Hyphomicrobiaceae bacterium MAG_BT-2024]